MKRKDYQDKYDHFSHIDLFSSSSKSRRLDPELVISYMNQDPFNCTDSEIVKPSIVEPSISTECFGDRTNDERAIVLYNPQANPPLYKSPSLSDFSSIVVNTDLIPGFKDRLMMLEQPKATKEEAIYGSNNNSLAMVPWVARPAETEEVEMMDVDEDDDEENVTNQSQQQQQQFQQYCLKPKVFHTNNTFSPVTW